ncbi:MAG TPA: hypothetical protein VIJ42_01010 [Stellaceae bacterium]
MPDAFVEKYWDWRIEIDDKGKPSLVVEVAPTTTTGARTVVCREGAEFYIERLRKMSKHGEPGDYVFAGYDGEPIDNFNKTFAKVLGDRTCLRVSCR